MTSTEGEQSEDYHHSRADCGVGWVRNARAELPDLYVETRERRRVHRMFPRSPFLPLRGTGKTDGHDGTTDDRPALLDSQKDAHHLRAVSCRREHQSSAEVSITSSFDVEYDQHPVWTRLRARMMDPQAVLNGTESATAR